MTQPSSQAVAPTAASPQPRTDSPAGSHHDGAAGFLGLGPWAVYGLFILVGLGVSALTMLIPWTPSYDPWCWLVWGKEIFHGGLHTAGGATWKPLPVIFTTVFALFGRAQPVLWLIVARAGFVVTVLMAGKLAVRLTLWLTPSYADRHSPEATRSRAAAWDRVAIWLPAALAGVLAVLTVALTSGWISDATLGYSEALAVAFLLIGFERHIDGHHRQAFALGLVAALDRPEIWLFWGAYGLWLLWHDRGARNAFLLVAGLAVLTLALWFVPQKLGGGSFTSGVTRATHVRANSPALAAFPFGAEFKNAWTLAIFRIKVGAIILIAVGALLLGYHWRTRNAVNARITLSPHQVRGLLYAVVAGVFGFAWWALIALETQAGFSGNSRYLTIGVATVDMAGAICYGAVAIILAELPRRWVPADRERLNLTQRMSLATVLLAAWFVAFPGWVGSNFIPLGKFHRSIVYQAGLRENLVSLINDRGGPRGLTSCGAGHIVIEGFQVPMMAWYLNDRTIEIEDQPSVAHPPAPWPNIVVQDRDTGGSALLPTWQQVNAWESEGAHYRVTTTKEMRFFEDCSAQPHDPPAATAS